MSENMTQDAYVGSWFNDALPNTGVDTTVSYGSAFTADVRDLPFTSVVSLVRKGLAHYLGNEMASRVSTRKAEWAKDHDGAEPDDTTVSAWKQEALADGTDAIRSGTIGASNRGPRGTTLETVMRRIAATELAAILKPLKLALPSGENTITIQGTAYTRGQMIQERLHGSQGPRIKKEAEKEIAKLERVAAKSAETTTDVVAVDLFNS